MLEEDPADLKQEVVRQQSRLRERYGHLEVDETVSDREFMSRHDRARYLAVGLRVLELHELAVRAAGPAGPVRRILDFGCGYGRVLRALRAGFPEATIVAADRVEEATRFCAEHFGAQPLPTPDRIRDLELDGGYDFVFAGSVFTHLNPKDFLLLLGKLTDALAEKGILIFTVAGRHVQRLVVEGKRRGPLEDAESRAMVRACEKEGIGFGRSARAGQVQREWGRSLVRPSWVVRQIEKLPHVRLLGYLERGHNVRQDVVSVVRVKRPGSVS